FWFEPAGETRADMRYVTNTNVLRTRITAADGVFDVYDYAPRIPAGLRVETPVEIHRVLVPREGEPSVRVHFDPRPDYARVRADIIEAPHGVDVLGGPATLHLRTNVPSAYLRNGLPVRLDQTRYFIL